ncbi:MAG: PilZ domain-containing protein [Candidatus Ancaeobacter aquaticus]|nr:PilZ domain-containing protein [Candidatus Ancaeobacter aquaticus]
MAESKYEGQNRRRFVRIPYEAVLRYKVYKETKKCANGACDDTQKHNYANADSKNLSSGGVMLTTKEHFPLHTILEIEMDVPSMDGYESVTIFGEVVRTCAKKNSELFDNGLSFYRIQQDDRKTIEDFLEFCPEASELGAEEM